MSQPVRLTKNNIAHQQRYAPAGSLIHWAGSATCPRKLSEKDVRVENLRPQSESSITYLAVADHLGNITCLRCRKEAWAMGLRA